MISVLSRSPRLVDGVEQASDVPVGVLGVTGEDLHLAGVELLLGVGERVPGREEVRPRGEFGILRDDPKLLLACDDFFAQLVPALVEFALVLVGPFFGDVVRRVAAAGRVEHHPRLGRHPALAPVQPFDGLVGDVVGEVVVLAVLAFRHTQRPVVLGDDRVVLAGGAAQEAPPVVEAPRLRPVVERAGRALHVVRGEVPLAEPAGDVAVFLEDARKRRADSGHGGGVAGEGAGIFGDRAEADPVLVAPGQQRGARRRADGRHVKAGCRSGPSPARV